MISGRTNPGRAGRSGTIERLGHVSRVLSLLILCIPAAVFAEESAVYREPTITDDDRQHWSFQPLAPVPVPDSAFPEWRRNEIDDFIGAALLRHNLRPQPSAGRRVLLRRLCFDLVGLPPSKKQLADFVSDGGSLSYDDLVDELLQSPGYGERWGQHWLDLARFAETDGFEHDKTRPDAWKYRDWVIQALNSDMPYDEFIRRQLAGDELYPEDESAVTATRFCLSGPDMPDINLLQERRHTVLNEMTSTVGEVILGLQVGCAQCHDHKYDPISQADFYRMRAVFEPALQLQKNKSLTVLQEKLPWQQSSHLMVRGDFRRPGPELQPGVLRVLSEDAAAFRPIQHDSTTGRRAALAEWIVSRSNPLTARVIVNRIWQHHFGTGLVETPGDFGIMGMEPSHPELLDWLARWLVTNDWHLKKLHRLILNSAAWRQRSMLPPEASAAEQQAWTNTLTVDPQARLLSRFPRRRLEAEVIRDTMLAASGQLNRKTGGPGVRPPLPAELVDTLLKNQWDVTPDVSEHNRRSIYVFARRNLRYPVFEVFDRPSANTSCSDRGTSTTATQSLFLLNSEFSLQAATQLAARIRQDHIRPEAQIDAAFQLTLGRAATDTERDLTRQFLSDHATAAANADQPLIHLCLSLFNCNEFLFID
ncbi:MAG: DUF1549 and DUF1553 domain-containing protein [Fuerstiella sp.]